MDKYIEEFMDEQKRKHCQDADTMNNLLLGDNDYSFVSQQAYEEPEYLEENIRNSVRRYPRNKDTAINIYKRFRAFLQKKGISTKVHFPPIPVSNTFERLMYIAKFFHDPEQKIDKLSEKLWVSSRTIEDDIKKLRGLDEDPIQICGKKFEISETDRSKGRIYSASTVHPLFLTLNLTQVIVMLKGLKAMSEKPLYANYAKTAAADIWEQLSDYAQKRIHYVLSELLPDDLTWYESLGKSDKNLFYTERACSVNNDVIGYCMKNNQKFCVEVRDKKKNKVYSNCYKCRFSLSSDNIELITFISDQGEKTIPYENILRSAYTPEELL